jgi:two-component sensor histidine kinase
MFQRIVEQQRPSEEWTASIFDQDGVHIARTPNPEQIVGKRASPSLYDQMMKTNEAKINTMTIEGQHVLTAFTRSPLTGWIVVAGVSTSTITVPLWRTLAITGAIGAILLAVGLFFAIGMATRIARAEALHGLLVNELNHRVKNTLATVQSIATQTFRTNSDSAEAQRKFSDRLVALGQAHGLLSEANWEGADVGGVAQRVLEPYATNPGRIRIIGPEILMPSAQALMLSMVFHELATNAVKYGALSSSSGAIVVEWRRDGNELALTWREHGGPPAHEPTQTGFGSRLITRGLAGNGGTAQMAYNESGLVCTIRCPIRAG